jgi:uncharacterized membrane protein
MEGRKRTEGLPMQKASREEHAYFIDRLRKLCAIWFFVGMPLNMLLSWVYFFAGIPLSSLPLFLSSLIYVSGSLLGGLWTREQLCRKRLYGSALIGTLVVFGVSAGLLCVGIVFAVIAFQHV